MFRTTGAIDTKALDQTCQFSRATDTKMKEVSTILLDPSVVATVAGNVWSRSPASAQASAHGLWRADEATSRTRILHVRAQRRIQPFPKGGAKRVPKSESLCKNCIWLCRTEEQKGGGGPNSVLAPRWPILAPLAPLWIRPCSDKVEILAFSLRQNQ